MVIVWFISQTRNICASTEYYNVNTVWHVATFTMQILLKEKLSTTIICLNILSVQMHFKMKMTLMMEMHFQRFQIPHKREIRRFQEVV